MFRDLRSRRRVTARRSIRVVEALESRLLLDASYHALAAGPLTQDWSDTSLITTNNDWSGVPSIAGFLGDGLPYPNGSDPRIITSSSLGSVAVLANLTNPNSGTGAGPAEFEIADPTVALRGGNSKSTPPSPAPSLVLYLDTTGTNSTHVAFDLRDIDGSTDNTIEPYSVQYRIGATDTFTNIPAGFIDDASRGPSQATLITHVDIVLPAAADNQAQVQVRIVTADAPSTDEWVGIDNINVSATADIPAGTFTFENITPSVVENAGTATVRVLREGGSTGPASVTINSGSGTATSGVDYTPVSTTLTFDDGQTFQDVVIPIADDTLLEGDETLDVTLSDATDGATVGANSVATLTIVDDEVTAPRINEVLVNPDGGTDNPYEFFEVRGVPNAPLANLYLIDVNGVSGTTQGFVNFAQSLSGTSLGSNGLLVVKAPTGGPVVAGGATVIGNRYLQEQTGLSNNAVTHLLISSPTPILAGQSLDTNIDGQLDLPEGAVVIDSVGWSDGSANALIYSTVVLSQASGTPDAASRFPHDLSTSSTAAWYNGDVVSNSPANPAELLYDGTKNSGNLPPGAALTPGDENIGVVNSAPISADSQFVAEFNTNLSVGGSSGLLSVCADPDGDPLGAILDSPVTAGTLTLSADGAFLYTPPTGFQGDATFTFHATDGFLNSPTQTVTIHVNAPPNVAPTISVPSGVQTITNHAPLIFANPSNFVVADADAGTDPVQITLNATHGVLTLTSTNNLEFSTGTGTNDESMTFTGSIADVNFALDGLTFTPVGTYHGAATISAAVDDLGHNGSGGPGATFASVDLDILDEAPVANPDTANGNEEAPLIINVLANDTDAENDPLTPVNLSTPTHGTVVVNADHTITYTPNAGYFGPDSFQYQASDGKLTSSLVTVSITLAAVNHAPVATADTVATNEDTQITFNVVANDTDSDGDPLAPVNLTTPLHGTVTVNANGTITYTPTANYNGDDSFQYQASDGTLSSLLTTVSITVNAVNDAPVAVDDIVVVAEDNTVVIDVLSNDTDVENSALIAGGQTSPLHGTLTANANGTFNYTPVLNYNGTDSFTYKVSDGELASAFATVSITINPVNDAPVLFLPSTVPTITEGTTIQLTVGSADPDGKSDTPHYSLGANAPAGMTINPVTGVVSWTSSDGPATVTVTVTVTDSATQPIAVSRDLSIRVDNVAPDLAEVGSVSLTPGGTFSTTGSFTDPGADTWHATVDYGDGSGTTPLTLNANKTFPLSHVYSSAGSFTGTLIVIDKDGASSVKSFTVNVIPNPVIVLIVEASTGKRGFTTFKLTLSDAINSNVALDASHYRLALAGKDRKFGTKDDPKIQLRTLAYDLGRHQVSITTRRRFALSRIPVRFSASGLIDTLGRPVDGNNDGQPGGDFAAIVTKNSISILSHHKHGHR